MTILTLNDMLGPGPQAQALQLQQFEACDALYDTLNRLNSENRQTPGWDHTSAYKHADYQQALAAYEATVTALEQLLGADAHCNNVDSDLWSLYSDLYKDRVGMRPRHHRSRAQVQAWLAQDAEQPVSLTQD